MRTGMRTSCHCGQKNRRWYEGVVLVQHPGIIIPQLNQSRIILWVSSFSPATIDRSGVWVCVSMFSSGWNGLKYAFGRGRKQSKLENRKEKRNRSYASARVRVWMGPDNDIAEFPRSWARSCIFHLRCEKGFAPFLVQHHHLRTTPSPETLVGGHQPSCHLRRSITEARALLLETSFGSSSVSSAGVVAVMIWQPFVPRAELDAHVIVTRVVMGANAARGNNHHLHRGSWVVRVDHSHSGSTVNDGGWSSFSPLKVWREQNLTSSRLEAEDSSNQIWTALSYCTIEGEYRSFERSSVTRFESQTSTTSSLPTLIIRRLDQTKGAAADRSLGRAHKFFWNWLLYCWTTQLAPVCSPMSSSTPCVQRMRQNGVVPGGMTVDCPCEAFFRLHMSAFFICSFWN